MQSKHMKSGSLKCKIIAPLLAAALIGTCVVPVVTSVNTATAASAEDEVGAGNVYSAPVNSSNSANEGLYWANATYFDYLSDVLTATTDNGGKATFTGLKAGTYTLKETNPPKGYNLNETEYTVTINANGTVTSAQYDATLKGVKIGDTPVVMPASGGQGTMIFTIVGISLIACAGVLFIVLKKRSSK